jgi:Holliday junction resolvase
VIAAKDGKVYVIELKFVSGTRTRFDGQKIHGHDGGEQQDGHDGLVGIATQFGGTPLLVSRFSGDTTFYAFTPSQAGPPTDSGAYSVSHDQCKQDALILP